MVKILWIVTLVAIAGLCILVGSRHFGSNALLTTHPSVDPYRSIIVLDSPDELNIPGKYRCGSYSVTEPNFYDVQATNLVLSPASTTLLRTVGKYPYQYDVTFSKDCRYLYYVDATNDDNLIQAISFASGTRFSIEIPDSIFLSVTSTAPGTFNATPILNFLYPIDAEHLLLSFENPSTGRDAATNQSTQVILDLARHAATVISVGGGSAPVLLDVARNQLIMPTQVSAVPVTDRTQIDLRTGMSTISALRTPYEFSLACDANTFATESEYIVCRDRWLERLLQ